MKFDINDFIDRLRRQALTKQEAGTRIYEEIRLAENTKVGFLDQAEENPDFYILISKEADQYITRLKVIHNKISPTPTALDQEMYQGEQQTIDLVMELIREIEAQTRTI